VQSDEDLRTRLDHQVGTQEAFLQVLKGGELELSEHPLPAYGDLLARSICNHQLFRTMGEALDKGALMRKVRIPWFPDPACIVTVEDALIQVCLHGQHHRGQNMTRFKAMGGNPRNVDYIIWLWKQKPEAPWPD
jgi:uncharacterized damage-inducible protein DinB